MPATAKLSALDQAKQFAEACRADGWSYEVRGSVVSIQKQFAPHDRDAYTACDMFAYDILQLAPLTGGSVWGTDGGSVGGYAGLSGGYYRLNKSGNGKRFLAALEKLKG